LVPLRVSRPATNIEDYPKLGHDAHFLIVGTNVYDDGAGFPVSSTREPFSRSPKHRRQRHHLQLSGHGPPTLPTPRILLKNTDGTLAFTPIPANASDQRDQRLHLRCPRLDRSRPSRR